MRFILPLIPLLLCAPVLAQTQPSKTVPLENRNQALSLVQKLLKEGKIMRPSEAKRGMKGYGLTVFQGTKIEKFGVEVLGTLGKVQGGGDLVMIRVTDGPVVKRQSGIIQGMSGSPVYLNGKLLGAVAIGFSFPKEPIGGVTPVTQMIETALPDNGPALPTPLGTTPKFKVSAYRPKAPLRIAGRDIARVEVSRDANRPAFSGAASRATMTMQPCTRLILMSGISPSSLGRWKNFFEPMGVTPVMGGGAMSAATQAQVFGTPSKKTGVKASLAPGAAIGVQLASGDIDATGVGTVTFREGNRVLAFGHPMFNLGRVSMPMTTAYVHDIYPSYEISFKLASPIQTVGELQADTSFAVGGTVGRRAETIPMHIRIVDSAKKIDRKFNMRLIKDPMFTPQLMTNLAAEAVQSTLGLDSGKTVHIAFDLKLKNADDIQRTNTVYADDQVLAGALGEVLDSISLTQQNPWEKGALEGLNLSVQVVPGRKTATIRRIYADRNRVKAGESVTISVDLEPTGKPGQFITRKFSVPVPVDSPDGTLRIAASSADMYWAGRARVGGSPPRPNNLRELVTAYQQIGPFNELLIQASTPKRFLLLDRNKISNPPTLWSRLIPSAPSTSLGTFNETIEQREKVDWVLSGLQTLAIPVESVRHTDRERPDGTTSDDSTGITSTSDDAPVATDADASSDADPDADTEPVEMQARTFGRAGFGFPVNDWESGLNLAPRVGRWSRQINAGAGLHPIALRTSTHNTTATAATPVPTATPTPTPTATPDPAAAAIARPAGKWVQHTAEEFKRGDFDGTAVRDDGAIVPAPHQSLVASTSEPVAWSVAIGGDTIYLGTGYNARLLKIQNGKTSVLFEGKEVGITALAVDAAGNLYAGASPRGHIYRFTPNGKSELLASVDESFVHALALQGNDLLIGTGGERGALYRIQNVATAHHALPKLITTTQQKHLNALAVVGDVVYAATGDDAVLYRISKDGTTQALYQATTGANTPSASSNAGATTTSTTGATDQANLAALLQALAAGGSAPRATTNEILTVAADGQAVFFGTVSSGVVWRWAPTGGVQELFKTSGTSIYSLRTDVDHNLYVGADHGEVWKLALGADAATIPPAQVRAVRLLDAPQPQVLALALGDSGVVAATGNNAAVYRVSEGDTDHVFTSNVFDASQIVRWGALRVLGDGVTVETRSGNTLEPDATWSDFVALDAQSRVQSPAARYLQYRARVAEAGSLLRVETVFRAPNRAPRLVWKTPAGGEAFSGKKTLSWTGIDPDSDPLRYSLVLRDAKGVETPLDFPTPTKSTFDFDTSKLANGVYSLTLRASDANRNPEDAQTVTVRSLPFVVDNTAPVLSNLKVTVDGGELVLAAKASDVGGALLAGAEWRVLAPKTDDATKKPATKLAAKAADTSTDTTDADDSDSDTDTDDTKPAKAKDGPWQAIAATDGVFDTSEEAIVGRLDVGASGQKIGDGLMIEIRVRDGANNSVKRTASLKELLAGS